MAYTSISTSKVLWLQMINGMLLWSMLIDLRTFSEIFKVLGPSEHIFYHKFYKFRPIPQIRSKKSLSLINTSRTCWTLTQTSVWISFQINYFSLNMTLTQGGLVVYGLKIVKKIIHKLFVTRGEKIMIDRTDPWEMHSYRLRYLSKWQDLLFNLNKLALELTCCEQQL